MIQLIGCIKRIGGGFGILHAHAKELGIDTSRICVLGDSAGGYVSQMAGTTNGEKEFEQGDFLDQSSDVQAAVTIYGISNLMNIGEGYPKEIQDVHASPAVTEALLLYGPAFADFAGNSLLSNPEKTLAASPMGHVKENMPPFLIMHGSEDKLVSPAQSEQLYKALSEKGESSRLYRCGRCRTWRLVLVSETGYRQSSQLV